MQLNSIYSLIYLGAAQYLIYNPRAFSNCLKCTKTKGCHPTHLILDMILWKEVLTQATTKQDCLYLLWVIILQTEYILKYKWLCLSVCVSLFVTPCPLII